MNDSDYPVDPLKVQALIEKVSIERPLKGGRVQEKSKSLYSSPLTTSLRAATEQADQLIARRGRERKP